METKQSPVARARGFWQGLDKRLRWALIIVAAALVVVIVALSISAQNPDYEILYLSMEPDDAADVYALLSDMSIPYKIEGTSRVTISVPKGKREETLLMLNNEGYPTSTQDIFSLYSESVGFASTESDKARTATYILEQTVAYSIKKMEKIEDAVVMITPEQKSQYAVSSSNTPAQASVVLTVKSGQTLSSAEAEAVRGVVLTAVAGLEAANVTIVDTGMHTYRLGGADGISTSTDDRIAYKEEAQELIKSQVYNLLYPVFGQEYVTVSANVELDWDRKSTQTITYSPPGDAENMGIIVSLRQTAQRLADGLNAQGVAGFDSNGAAPFYPEDFTDEESPYFYYTQELNAELNEVREQIEQAAGKWKSVNVAVMLHAGEEWDEEIESLRTSVANGVGIDPAYVTIMRTSFKTVTDMEEIIRQSLEEGEEEDDNTNILFLAIAGGVLLLAIVVILLMANRAKKQKQAYEAELKRIEEEQRLLAAQKAAEEQEAVMLSSLLDEDGGNARLKDLQQLTDENPEIVAQLLRNWLSDDVGR